MKRISSLIACGVIALGFATSINAQTRTSQLIITNSKGTAKVSMAGTDGQGNNLGVTFDQYLTLCRPGNANSMITLMPPSSNGVRCFTFPETAGELLTTNSEINANQITNISGAMPTIAGNQTINVTTDVNGDYTLGINLNNPNTWTAVQTFLANEAQGNVFINAINNGTTLLSGYVTLNDFNTSITNLQTSITNLTTASANYLEAGDLAVTSPITLTGTTFGMETSPAAGTYTNANITVDAFGRVTAAANGAVNSATYSHPQLTSGQTHLSSDIAGKSYVELSSNHNGDANGRKFTLPAGVPGQIMLLRNTAGNCLLNPYLGNLSLTTAASFAFFGEAHILLYWTGVQWVEISRRS